MRLAVCSPARSEATRNRTRNKPEKRPLTDKKQKNCALCKKYLQIISLFQLLFVHLQRESMLDNENGETLQLLPDIMKKVLSSVLLLLFCSLAMGQEETAATDKIEKAFKEQNVEVNLNANTSEETIEVYNLCGQLVANQLDKLPKGVYIVKQDGTSRKVVIR